MLQNLIRAKIIVLEEFGSMYNHAITYVALYPGVLQFNIKFSTSKNMGRLGYKVENKAPAFILYWQYML